MPIYEYRRADGTTFEVIQKFTDDPLTKDPDTGKPVERVYSAPAIHFKGSGFHNTDYGSNRRAKSGSSGSSESSDSGSSSSAESKPVKSDSKAGAEGKSSKADKAPKKD